MQNYLLKFSLISATVLFATGTAHAQLQCVDLYLSNQELVLARIESARDPIHLPLEWLDSMDRDGVHNLRDINYVRNVTRAIFGGFRSWFKGESELSFVEFLKQQHLETIYGRSLLPENWYLPLKINETTVVANVQPGRMRSDTSYVRNPLLEQIVLFPRYFKQDLTPAEMQDLAFNSKGKRTQIDGIPVEAQTVSLGMLQPGEVILGQKLTEPMLIHRYADPKYIHIYLNRMNSTLLQLRQLYYAPRTKENRLAALKLLAHYHQLYINALPFGRVNNSIAMAQINYLLLEFGFNPINHGDLDIVCLVVNSKRYEQIFLKAVQNKN